MPTRPGYLRPAHSRARPPMDRSGAETRERKATYNTSRWGALRAMYLAHNPLCEECQRHGEIVPAEQVHHRLDLSVRPDMAFDMANLEALCRPCHSRETARRVNGGR